MFCQLFSAFFNIMSVVFAHQLLAGPQEIDSREGLFRWKMGLVVNVGKMNIYFMIPPFSPYFGRFAAKYTAFWCKTHCVLVLNALRFGAKWRAF